MTTQTNNNAPVRFSGTPFEFGHQMLIIPPLPIGLIEECDDEIEALGPDPDVPPANPALAAEFKAVHGSAPISQSAARKAWLRDRMRVMKTTIGIAIRRNHPDFNDDDLAEFVTMANVFDAFQAAQGTLKGTKVKTVVGEAQPGLSA